MLAEKRATSPMEVMGPRDEKEYEEEGSVSSAMRTAETLLRLVPVGLCVAALVVMLKNSQTNDFGSISYSDLGAFRCSFCCNFIDKYLVHANGICAGYSLLSAIIVAMPRPSTMSSAWTFFFLDQVLTYAILAAGAVSLELLFLAYKGDAVVTWSAACGSFGGFCLKATASVVITFVVVACYAVLSLISSYKLFSKFDAPAVNPTKGIDLAAFQG
ncbi:CASP-like protein 2A1 isoform X1 [Juglans microcarpa x Juglans regia]|uniref:CASP-like protein 2A1 isoform X1 n=1 Tax=Juglans microcarpa x Juglans regia TaxID=2249226 RepID=UPI001B7F0B18|nr:CASP-like protein 2A1 isoform X1 [Juglans microcarpa x Juglans regia]